MEPQVHPIFSPGKIGPIQLRNRTIRSAAFEGMCPGGAPSDQLVRYHRSVAAGGVGMTTVAYAAVLKSGLTFTHQLWMRREIVAGLRALTDAIHREGAAASIQLGHAGYMADRKAGGVRPIAPSAVFNLFGLVMPRAMTQDDLRGMVSAFSDSVKLAREAGFDAVEVQAGHGYLLSQFLAPHTNRRGDEYGGTLEHRARLVREVVRRVREAAGAGMAVVVKTNVQDGFSGGMGPGEAVEVARMLEQDGADALVVSGGFVSKCPFFMMRGEIPLKELIIVQPMVNKVGLKLFGRFAVEEYPFAPAFFLDDAKGIRAAVRLPVVLVGGLNSLDAIDAAMGAGYEFVAMARALIREPDFVNLLKSGESRVSKCEPCNKCVAYMYNGPMRCPDREKETGVGF